LLVKIKKEKEELVKINLISQYKKKLQVFLVKKDHSNLLKKLLKLWIQNYSNKKAEELIKNCGKLYLFCLFMWIEKLLKGFKIKLKLKYIKEKSY